MRASLCWHRNYFLSASLGIISKYPNLSILTGAIILGPRIDRFRDHNSKYISGHSTPLIALGGFILLFGFMAFNAGSQVEYYWNALLDNNEHSPISGTVQTNY